MAVWNVDRAIADASRKSGGWGDPQARAVTGARERLGAITGRDRLTEALHDAAVVFRRGRGGLQPDMIAARVVLFGHSVGRDNDLLAVKQNGVVAQTKVLAQEPHSPVVFLRHTNARSFDAGQLTRNALRLCNNAQSNSTCINPFYYS